MTRRVIPLSVMYNIRGPDGDGQRRESVPLVSEELPPLSVPVRPSDSVHDRQKVKVVEDEGYYLVCREELKGPGGSQSRGVVPEVPGRVKSAFTRCTYTSSYVQGTRARLVDRRKVKESGSCGRMRGTVWKRAWQGYRSSRGGSRVGRKPKFVDNESVREGGSGSGTWCYDLEKRL